MLVWAVPISLATTLGITIVFFSSGYLDVSVLRVYLFRFHAFSMKGCPIRKSTDQGIFAPPRSLSQLITSFVDYESQGIHHTLLITFLIIYSYLFTINFLLYFLSICQRTLFRSQRPESVDNTGIEPIPPDIKPSECSTVELISNKVI